MSNLTATTRELWDRTVVDEVFEKLALFAILKESRQMTWKGGTKIKKTVKMATTEDLSQDYGMNDGLAGGSKTTRQCPEFGWKNVNHPIAYTAAEDMQNAGGPDTAPVDLVDDLVAEGQTGVKRHFASLFYTVNGTGSDAGKKFQSVIDALDVTCTPYGGITRSASVATWWQGASPAGSWTDQDTAAAPSIANLRKWIDACRAHRDPGEKMYGVCGSTIWRSLQSQMEVRTVYPNPPKMLKYGFDSMIIEGVEIVKDPYLDTLAAGTTTKYFFLINPETWEFRLHPTRSFKFTGFTWQGDQVGGLDAYLARILATGNLVCWQPNANMFLSNVG